VLAHNVKSALQTHEKSLKCAAGLHWRFATVSRKPRQVRKEAAVVVKSGAGVSWCRPFSIYKQQKSHV